MKNVSSRIKQGLWARFRETSSKQIDNRGYASNPQDNLLPGVKLTDFQSDYQQGSGNELADKFRAVHSLFFEPTNWQDINICVQHQTEIEEFGEQVGGTSVEFVAQSYPELWAEWENHFTKTS